MRFGTEIVLALGLVLGGWGLARGGDIQGSSPVSASEECPNPYPRPIVLGRVLKEWTFDRDAEGWEARHDCKVTARSGRLHVQNAGDDPHLGTDCKLAAPAGGGLAVRLRMRSNAAGTGGFFWITESDPRWSPQKKQSFTIEHDGKWHEYEVALAVRGKVKGLRLDPGTGDGKLEVDWIRVHEGGPHPLEICRLEAPPALRTGGPDIIRAHVRNHGRQEMAFSAGGRQYNVAGGKTVIVPVKPAGRAPFETCTVEVQAQGLPPVRRTTVLWRPEVKAEWIRLESRFATVQWAGKDRDLTAMIAREEVLSVHVARDGSGAAIFLNKKLIAYVAPLVWHGAEASGSAPGIPKLAVAESSAEQVRFTGDGLKVRIALEKGEIEFHLDSARLVEGPVIRAVGSLEQGLFAGLEYLGKGERSSSKLDIETADHLRFAPDPLKVTMPLMTFLTDRSAVAMTWKDMSLTATYATPNFFDGTADHRMSLRGRKIHATLLVREAALEGTILWAVKRMGGLPALPKPPRSRAEQWKLALAAINGSIRGKGGWGHCAEPRWPRHPYADIASTLWRLTGQVPQLERIVPGGAHVPNDAIFFVTGRAAEWLPVRKRQADGLIAAQGKDGSFRYTGKPQYRRGHFEDTSSGWCAFRARLLLEFARVTGDETALAAGLKTLEYMRRFRTPRGAQTWELSLHTPDVLASANLVWSYVRGYELTGQREYLGQARRWALSGVPFVYLWGRYPIMKYASVPVYGATNFRAPLWIGRPVQWCGGVYAYAVALLAEHDRMLDWERLARGILIAGEQMQYPDGRLIGCLPDVFHLSSQQRAGPSINPCALAGLRMVLDGEVDSLSVATDGKHRIASPFRVQIIEGHPKARIQAKKGTKYQVLIDGRKIVNVESKGVDEVPLE